MEETGVLSERAWEGVIEKFLSKKTPEEYDFKLMRGYDGKKSVDKWFAYKTLKDGFDCDTCELAKAIYHCLWGWEMESKNSFRNSLLFQKNLGEGVGGDTMNSLGTTMEKYMKKRGVKKCKEQWESEKEETRKKAEEIGLEDFAKFTSCIGNFVLVPARFNGHRGIHSCIRDYWDLSLDYLAYEEKSAWLSMYKEPMNQKTDNKAFAKYINMFFLWDYVGKGYKVKPLFDSHKGKLGDNVLSSNNVFPSGEKEFEQYFNRANTYIKRRGVFMVAMLKLAVDFKNVKINIKYKDNWESWDVSAIYKYIVKEVFLQDDKTYSDYDEVFGAIEKAINDIKKKGGDIPNGISDILKEAQNLIKNVEENTNDKKRSS